MSRGRAWLVAVVATLAMSVSYIDRQVVAAVATSVRRSLDIDAEHFGWLAGAFSLAYLLAAPLSGAVVDRIGARRGLVGAMVVWTAVCAAHALAPSFAALFTLRILLGVSESPSFPAAAQSVSRALPSRDRSAAFGLLFTGSSVGAAVAAPLAIALDVRFGWRAAFVVTSILCTAWLPLWLLVTRPAEVRSLLGRSPVAAPASSHGLPSLTWRDPLLRDPAVVRAVVMVLASAPALMFMFLWLPQYLELSRAVPKPELGRYVWLPPVMADVGMIGFGVLASRLDRRSAATGPRSHVELVLLAAALESTLALVPQLQGRWPPVLAISVSAAGGGGLYVLATADMMARVDPARVSMAGGMTAAAQSLVYVLLNPAVGRWFDRTHSFDVPLVMLGVVALPGALAWTAWRTRRLAPVTPGP
jgi:ACS family hexuronate transporter-like MFS transporter